MYHLILHFVNMYEFICKYVYKYSSVYNCYITMDCMM